MAGRRSSPSTVDALVDHMFRDVFTEDERRQLLLRIRDWEAANPEQSSADRVTGWIDVAYALQAERAPRRPEATWHLEPTRGLLAH